MDATRYETHSFSFGGFKILGDQSRDNCFILNMCEGRDNHENNLKYFGFFFMWGVEKHNQILSIEQVSLPMDLKSQWEVCKLNANAQKCHLCVVKVENWLADTSHGSP
jgi:hypothetical protein